MTDTVHRELEVPSPPSETWEHVLDPTWLGGEGELPTTPGSEGWVKDGDVVRYLVVEEVVDEERYVYRWATFAEAPSRVQIELEPSESGSRISITESPIVARALASLILQ